MKRKALLAALLLCSVLSGCGQQAADAAASPQAAPAGEEAGPPLEDGSTLARVAAVEGSTLTLETMQHGGGRAPQQDGGAPARTDGDAPAQGEKPTADGEDGAAQGEKPAHPDGEPPAGGTPAPDGASPADGEAPSGGRKPETLTLTLSDGCQIFVQKDGSQVTADLSAVTAGSMVRLSFADDGETVETVVVMQDAGPGDPPPTAGDGPAQEDTPAA